MQIGHHVDRATLTPVVAAETQGHAVGAQKIVTRQR
jgi:hypothetical protein